MRKGLRCDATCNGDNQQLETGTVTTFSKSQKTHAVARPFE
jgi:hypothetical protein